MKSLLISLTVLTGVVTLTGCGGGGAATTPPTSTTSSTQMPGVQTQVAGGSYWIITPAQLAALKRTDFFLVDVDDAPTIVIASTDLFVKASEIARNLSKFPTDKSRKIVVYCIVGNTSRSAAAQLVAAGYTQVMHLQGGVMNWQAQGYPVVSYTATT